MTVRKIEFGDEGQVATRELLRRFDEVAAKAPKLASGPLPGWLRTLEALDRQHGGSGALPVEDAAQLVAALHAELARFESEPDVADLTLGVALWALRHEVPLDVVEPVANALAIRSNRAANKQELAAIFGLMQGIIAAVSPRLSADLERSNPERPWRILHANYAITAIRTEDPVLMGHAFDALDAALPDERAGFYSEALALALSPRVAPEVREALQARHRRWTQSLG